MLPVESGLSKPLAKCQEAGKPLMTNIGLPETWRADQLSAALHATILLLFLPEPVRPRPPFMCRSISPCREKTGGDLVMQ